MKAIKEVVLISLMDQLGIFKDYDRAKLTIWAIAGRFFFSLPSSCQSASNGQEKEKFVEDGEKVGRRLSWFLINEPLAGMSCNRHFCSEIKIPFFKRIEQLQIDGKEGSMIVVALECKGICQRDLLQKEFKLNISSSIGFPFLQFSFFNLQ